MGTLLKADFLKLWRSRSFRVGLVFSLLLGAVMEILYYYAWQSLNANMEQTKEMINNMGAYANTVTEALAMLPKTNLWEYVNIALSDLNVLFIAAVMVSIFVGSEYTMGTLKNAVSRGYSRSMLYGSKLMVSAAATVWVVLVYVLGGLVPGMVMFGFSGELSAGTILLILAAYLVQFLAAVSFYMMLTVLCRRTGYAVAFSMIVPLLMSALINVVKIGNKDFDRAARFWLFECIGQTQTLCTEGSAFLPFAVALIYLVLCTAVGLLVFRRQEIK